MRKIIFLIILVLMCAVVLAEIRLFNFTKERYNLGDNLVVSLSIRAESDFDGLFKTALVCNNNPIEYFITPMRLKANEQRSIDVAPLQLIDPSFVGNCYVKANLKPFGNFSGEEFQSQGIVVTDEIPITISINKENLLPGETLTISGEARTTHESFQRATLQIMLDERAFNYPLENRSFSHSYDLGVNIKSGKHKISLSINDVFGNHGSAEKEFSVIPIPTLLVNRLVKTEFEPEEEINFEVVLYDQANDTMQGKASTQILGSDKQILLNVEQDTQKIVSYKLKQTATPGTYTIISTSNSLKAEDTITVKELRRIDISFDKQYLTFKNTGNVVYGREFDVIIKNGREYSVPVKLDLQPEGIYEIDMFKQVPEGTYTIVVPKEDKYLVYENVFLEDHRPFTKKVTMTTAATTGALFGEKGKSGLLTRKPVIALIILIIIVATIAVLAFRKRKIKKPQF